MNDLKNALASGRVMRGLWQTLPGPEVAELAARIGFDWIVLDGEHGAWDPSDIRRRLIAAPDAIVRVPCHDDWILKQALDLGAQTVLVPMVDRADQARAAVAACRYPPEGVRGVGAMVARAAMYGTDPGYTDRANGTVSVWVQVESGAALSALEEICATPGVDCVFIGPADLAADLGKPLGGPDMRIILEDAIARIRAAGKPAGIFAAEPEHWVSVGAQVVTLGADSMVLAQALAALR
ncbi:MAG: aldolase/citrate lyase family protein [Pseudomonadota bacterium]